jgi:hypothetical protein
MLFAGIEPSDGMEINPPNVLVFGRHPRRSL